MEPSAATTPVLPIVPNPAAPLPPQPIGVWTRIWQQRFPIAFVVGACCIGRMVIKRDISGLTIATCLLAYAILGLRAKNKLKTLETEMPQKHDLLDAFERDLPLDKIDSYQKAEEIYTTLSQRYAELKQTLSLPEILCYKMAVAEVQVQSHKTSLEDLSKAFSEMTENSKEKTDLEEDIADTKVAFCAIVNHYIAALRKTIDDARQLYVSKLKMARDTVNNG